MVRVTKTSKIKILDKKKRKFSTGAKRQSAKGKGTPVLIPPEPMIELAKHFEGGAEIYGPRNWEKGLPLSEIMNSTLRHGEQEKLGLTDEQHDIAMMWNIVIYVATKIRIRRGLLPKELDDIPSYIPKRCVKHHYDGKKRPRNKCDICQMVWENKK